MDATTPFQEATQAVTLASESAPTAQPWRFVEIKRYMPDGILEQLVDRDRVHLRGARSVEELRRFRLGDEGFTHRCYGIMVGDKVQSVINVEQGYDDIESYMDLNGDIGEILTTESEFDSRNPKSFVCYSISAVGNLPKAGQILINELHAHLTQRYPGAHLTTLSPARPFDVWYEVNKHDYRTIEEAGARFMLGGHNIFDQEGSKRPGVHGFHAGNGAFLGAVRVDAGDVSNDNGVVKEHKLMVHHIYPALADALTENIMQIEKARKLIMASSLGEPKTAASVRDILSSTCAKDILVQARLPLFAKPADTLTLHR